MTTTQEDQFEKDDPFEALRVRLEERYEFHTGQLGGLLAADKDSGSAAVNAVVRSQSRQALSEIAGALRQMAEGTYGRCLDCQTDIPIDRLQARPDSLHCATCQETQDHQHAHRSQAA